VERSYIVPIGRGGWRVADHRPRRWIQSCIYRQKALWC